MKNTDSQPQNTFNIDTAVLEYIGDYYVNGVQSFGHGRDDHIASVIIRATEVGVLLNASGKANIDMETLKYVAALHDIGNCISRKGHNHFGYGIVRGELNLANILDVPNKDAEGNYMTQSVIDTLKKHIKENHGTLRFTSEDQRLLQKHENNKTLMKKISPLLNDESIDEKTRIKIERMYHLEAWEERDLRVLLGKLKLAELDLTFDAGYLGKAEYELRDHATDKYNLPANSFILNYLYNSLVDETGQYKDEALKKSKNELDAQAVRLQELTTILDKTFRARHIEPLVVAEAIQDHNIDYETPLGRTDSKWAAKKTRYESRSDYGMIIADADKSNDPIQELTRTIKYAVEKSAKEGDTKLIMYYKYPTSDELIPILSSEGKTILKMDALKENVESQFMMRYATGGIDNYKQLDTAYHLGINEKMYWQITKAADSKEAFDVLYKTTLGLLVEQNMDSGKTVSKQECLRLGIQTDDLYKFALSYMPEDLSFLQKHYHVTPNQTTRIHAEEIHNITEKLRDDYSKTRTLSRLDEQIVKTKRELTELQESSYQSDDRNQIPLKNFIGDAKRERRLRNKIDLLEKQKEQIVKGIQEIDNKLHDIFYKDDR